jgi:hypothetical protein
MSENLALFDESWASIDAATSEAPVIESGDGGERRRDDELFKKWFRTRDKSGFISVREAFEIGKVAIDIGEADGGSLSGATMVYTNAIPFTTYLRTVANGAGAVTYPANQRQNLLPESFVYYGGGTNKENGQPISRILKVTYWNARNEPDTSAFEFKNGHFAASRSNTGAFIPDMSKPISVNLIKYSGRPLVCDFYSPTTTSSTAGLRFWTMHHFPITVSI